MQYWNFGQRHLNIPLSEYGILPNKLRPPAPPRCYADPSGR